jgi:hypothetical protein
MALKNLNQTPTLQSRKLSDSDMDPVRSLNDEQLEETKEIKPVVYGVFILLVVFGVITGFILSRGAVGSQAKVGAPVSGTTDGKKSVGVSDTKTFTDSATGVIESGGLEDEGTHKLIRDGGPSQTVYMISSVVDLDEFTGKKVTVWGQTMAARNVPWLMDVGKVNMRPTRRFRI